MPIVHPGPKIVAILQCELVRVAGGRRVSHLHEFLVVPLNVSVFRLDGVTDGAAVATVDESERTE